MLRLNEWNAPTMTLNTATIDLPAVLNVEACQNLHAFLQQAAGTPVTLDCGAVTRIGGLAAQLIRMAATEWAAQDVPFALADPSADCRNCLEILGFDTLLNEHGGAQ